MSCRPVQALETRHMQVFKRAHLSLRLLAALLTLAAFVPSCNTRPILKIGLSAPFTGWDEPLGYDVLWAVRLALRESNQQGGAGGYLVELAALDDRNEPAEAAQQARELAIDPDVLAALGGLDSDAALAAAPEYHKAGLAFIAINATADSLTQAGYPEVFRLSPTDDALALTASGFALHILLSRNVAILYDAGGTGLAMAFQAAMQRSGAKIVYIGEVQRWQLDFTSQVDALRAKSPDLVFFAGHASEAGPFLKQARKAGLRFAFLGGPATEDPRLGQIAGAAADNAYALGVAALPGPGPFLTGYTALAGHPPSPRAALAYDATRLLLAAIERAAAKGRPTRAGLLTEIAKTQGYQGITGPITFDKKGDNLVARPLIYRFTGNLYPGTAIASVNLACDASGQAALQMPSRQDLAMGHDPGLSPSVALQPYERLVSFQSAGAGARSEVPLQEDRAVALPLSQVAPSGGLGLPLVDSEWLLIVSRSQQRLTTYRQGREVKSYSVSTGKPETLTPLGWWKIVEKFPLSPPGIYGTRWLGWERWNPREGRYEWYRESPPFGIHGTNEPEKIGTAVSAGCVRLRNRDVEELYEMIPVGTYVLVIE